MNVSFPDRFNMADYFLYHNLDEGRENKVCLYFEDKQWTYSEVARLSNKTGNALREVGAHIEERVLIVLPDCPEFVWAWFGAARIGAVITMVNPLLPADDYRYYLEYTRARVVIAHESFIQPLVEAGASSEFLRAFIVVRSEDAIDAEPLSLDTRVTAVSFSEIVDAQLGSCQAAETHRDDIAIWLF